MHAYYCDQFVLPLPGGHRFPMDKYRLLRERVAALAATEAIELRVPEPIAINDLLRVHETAYVQRVMTGALEAAEQRRIGFPWSEAMVARSRRSVGGTLAAARDALADGCAVNLAGGTHHAHAAAGRGYCVFNDVVVAIRTLRAAGVLQRALVVDLDVHHGDGTAALCAGDADTFTLSLHSAKNYPAVKPAGDLDRALPDGTGDGDYLRYLDEALETACSRFTPDIVFYLAGADPYRHDRLGRLALSRRGLAARDRRVFDCCERQGWPVAVVMAGGYAERLSDIVDIHLNTVIQAARLAGRPASRPAHGSPHGSAQRSAHGPAHRPATER